MHFSGIIRNDISRRTAWCVYRRAAAGGRSKPQCASAHRQLLPIATLECVLFNGAVSCCDCIVSVIGYGALVE